MSFELGKRSKIIAALLLVSVSLLSVSYASYEIFNAGIDQCASSCQTWISPLDPRNTLCTTVCAEKPEPNPLYLPTLYLGAIGLVLTGIYSAFTTVRSFKIHGDYGTEENRSGN